MLLPRGLGREEEGWLQWMDGERWLLGCSGRKNTPQCSKLKVSKHNLTPYSVITKYLNLVKAFNFLFPQFPVVE